MCAWKPLLLAGTRASPWSLLGRKEELSGLQHDRENPASGHPSQQREGPHLQGGPVDVGGEGSSAGVVAQSGQQHQLVAPLVHCHHTPLPLQQALYLHALHLCMPTDEGSEERQVGCQAAVSAEPAMGWCQYRLALPITQARMQAYRSNQRRCHGVMHSMSPAHLEQNVWGSGALCAF